MPRYRQLQGRVLPYLCVMQPRQGLDSRSQQMGAPPLMEPDDLGLVSGLNRIKGVSVRSWRELLSNDPGFRPPKQGHIRHCGESSVTWYEGGRAVSNLIDSNRPFPPTNPGFTAEPLFSGPKCPKRSSQPGPMVLLGRYSIHAIAGEGQ